ncbi:hypothetical protein FALCPG4_002078 [Fusarium falciforme]
MNTATTTTRTVQEAPISPFQGVGRSTRTDNAGERISEFLTANNGVTGREPNTNPPDWRSDQRRVPAHRPPVVHDDWVAIGGPLPVRLFLWTMFHGCEMLRWAYTFPTALGLHDRGYFQYQVAGEW